MKKYFLLFLLFIFFASQAQTEVLPKYPENQDFYKGGYKEFYTEAHDFLTKSDLKPCENKSEVYLMKILVNADGTVNYVKDPDSTGVKNNKCTFDIARKVLSNLKNFTPAEVNGTKTPAIARIMFNSDELFNTDHFSSDKTQYINAEFPGGIANYRKKFISCFDTNGYFYSKSFRFIINFDVDTQGNIQNIYIDTAFANERFIKMIVDCVIPRKLKFKPATYKGTPVTSRFTLPVTINSN